ncbi:N-acetylneuraminate synthase family protein [bacterium]|nr:N-acetylneuraminate synthase family protein [bacterium]|tara:strand:- start:708 stop:1766 length:1059 start_codon:yes stop_codon:yes gene_type:complete
MIKIGRSYISNKKIPYIIAEIGVNHGGCVKKAIRMIDMCKRGGANAVKFQSYKAEKIASKFSPSYWDLKKEKTKTQYQLFKKYDTFSQKDYIKLHNHCKKKKIDFLSTPFDDEAVDFLKNKVPAFKIASADITNYPLLRKVANTKKPIIISTGASTKNEIRNAIKFLKKNGCTDKKIILLHCILNYPTLDKNANLLMIKDLINSFPRNMIGYSDHTLPCKNMYSTIMAYSLGAVVIEKHFTYNKKLTGNDHYHAMNENDLRNMLSGLNKAKALIGENNKKKPINSEKISIKNARRSIVLKRDIKKGDVINKKDIIPKRPGHGISPIFWDDIIGRRVKKNLKSDQILKWNDLV